MNKEVNNKSRNSNKIEQFIIERCIRNIRLAYIEGFPEYGKVQNIEYEYLKIFEYPPLFGYDNIFISINSLCCFICFIKAKETSFL